MRREFWHQRIFAVYSFLQFRLSTIASSYSVNSIHSALSVGCKLKMPGQCQVRLVLMFFCLVYVVYHPFIHFVCCQQWRAIHSALSRMQAENELLWCARWGALCTISGLRGHPTPSAEVHCSMHKYTNVQKYNENTISQKELFCTEHYSIHKCSNMHATLFCIAMTYRCHAWLFLTARRVL